jgi:cholesterol oxidase
VGGGSLVYSNVLYEPKSEAFYTDKQWAHITDWRQELAPYYDQAKRMLGRTESPTLTVVDELARKVAAEMGVERSFELTPVGVFFGQGGRKEPGVDAEDPFFGGVGPRRRGCIECGECMTGCRHGAKNTLVKNYLYLAELAGATIHPERTVTAVRPRPGGGYRVDTSRTGAWRRRSTIGPSPRTSVVISAGTWGTQQLLHRMKADGVLPISPTGSGCSAEPTRNRSEALPPSGVTATIRLHQGRGALPRRSDRRAPPSSTFHYGGA